MQLGDGPNQPDGAVPQEEETAEVLRTLELAGVVVPGAFVATGPRPCELQVLVQAYGLSNEGVGSTVHWMITHPQQLSQGVTAVVLNPVSCLLRFQLPLQEACTEHCTVRQMLLICLDTPMLQHDRLLRFRLICRVQLLDHVLQHLVLTTGQLLHLSLGLVPAAVDLADAQGDVQENVLAVLGRSDPALHG